MKKKYLISLLLLIYVLAPLQSKAQEKPILKDKISFSLEEAVEYALLYNRKVKNADLSIQIAEKKKWETIAKGLPHIDGNLDYDYAFLRPDALASSPGDGGFSPAFFFPKHKVTAGVLLSQLIFDGMYIVGLQSSKVFLEISKNAKNKTNKEVKKAVVSAYSNVLLTKESLAILEKNIKNLKTNVNETNALLENGFAEQEAAEQLQLTLNGLENNLDNLKNLEKISKNMLKLLMGYKTTQNITITDGLEKLSETAFLSNIKQENISVFNNTDYKIAKNDTEAKRLLLKLEQYRRLPSLSSFLSAGYFGQSNAERNDKFEFFSNEQVWFENAMFGLRLKIPIFSSNQSLARTKQARMEWEISKNELTDMEEELAIKIESTKSELQLALKTLENKKKSLNLAERIEKKNNLKYTEGIASSFELRQAQTQLYSSQQEYLQAMVNLINKRAELNALKN